MTIIPELVVHTVHEQLDIHKHKQVSQVPQYKQNGCSHKSSHEIIWHMIFSTMFTEDNIYLSHIMKIFSTR